MKVAVAAGPAGDLLLLLQLAPAAVQPAIPRPAATYAHQQTHARSKEEAGDSLEHVHDRKDNCTNHCLEVVLAAKGGIDAVCRAGGA